MLRDYKLSLTLVAVILLGYTAMVIFNKRPALDPRAANTALKAAVSASAAAASSVVEEVSTATSSSSSN